MSVFFLELSFCCLILSQIRSLIETSSLDGKDPLLHQPFQLGLKPTKGLIRIRDASESGYEDYAITGTSTRTPVSSLASRKNGRQQRTLCSGSILRLSGCSAFIPSLRSRALHRSGETSSPLAFSHHALVMVAKIPQRPAESNRFAR